MRFWGLFLAMREKSGRKEWSGELNAEYAETAEKAEE